MFTEIATIAGCSFIGWILASLNINRIRDFKKPVRIAAHYVGEVIIFGLVFFAYFSWFETTFSTFSTILTCLLSLLVYEMLAWWLYYKGVPWYYGFIHWWFPSYLIAGVIYGVRYMVG